MGQIARNSFIVSPVDICNLYCGYCIDPARRSGGRMSAETLSNSMRLAVEYSTNIGRVARFIWHGGEPLLAGVGFYQRVVSYTNELRSKGHVIQHSIQTNGTLLTPELAEFLYTHGFSVSFSLDGPQNICNETRSFPNGKGAFEAIFAGIKNYAKYSSETSAICVINGRNSDSVSEVASFCQEQDISIQFNPWYEQPGSASDLSLSPKKYADAAIELFERWFESEDQKTNERDSSSPQFLEAILSRQSSVCRHSINCQLGGIFAIDHLGQVMPCSRFFGNAEFILGNVNDSECFQEIAESEFRSRLQQRHNLLDSCNTCRHFEICGGGCMQHAYAHSGSVFARDPMCGAYQRIFDHVESKVELALSKAQITGG